MDDSTARELIALNTRFYAEHAASFSATRSAPWEGWRRVADRAARALPPSDRELRVLDLACGNLRFERFIEADAARPARIDAVDNCDDLGRGALLPGMRYHSIDILEALIAGDRAEADPFPQLVGARYDLCACFGFMHHVPGARLRELVLEQLVERARPRGHIAVSFWQFMDDDRLARKAAASLEATRTAPPWDGFDPNDLERGDHLLGWQGDAGAYRYCHHFDEAEIDGLARGVADRAVEVDRFSADGASHALNRYLILQKR